MGQVLEGKNGVPIGATPDGRLHTEAVSLPEEHEAALENNAYTMDIDGIQPDGANYWVAVIKNTADEDMVITSITGWVSSFENTQIYEAVIGQTFTYAANGTAVVPVNTKSGISGGADGDFYVNDGSGNITTVGGTGLIVGRYIFTTTPLKWTKGTGWIVPKNQTFMIWSNLAEKLNGYISFYYHG